jgi:hypothetical protein
MSTPAAIPSVRFDRLAESERIEKTGFRIMPLEPADLALERAGGAQIGERQAADGAIGIPERALVDAHR